MPLVLLLALGLLLSLIRCADCELNFAAANAQTAIVSHGQGPASDAPEQTLLCHSGHCLLHVAAQLTLSIALPADLLPRAHMFRQEQFPTALAGLPLFKPPRA